MKSSKAILFYSLIITGLLLGCNENPEDSEGNGGESTGSGPLASQPAGSCPSGTREVHLPNGDDQIIIESENTDLQGNFIFRDSIPGYKGRGYIVYRRSGDPGDSNHNYDGVSEVSYHFIVTTAGEYTFDTRGARATLGLSFPVCASHSTACCPATGLCSRADLNNDMFNDYLGSFQKAYLGIGQSKDQWHTLPKFDIHGQSHFTGKMQLTAGEYIFKLRGRSNFHASDRFALYLSSAPNLAQADGSDVVCL